MGPNCERTQPNSATHGGVGIAIQLSQKKDNFMRVSRGILVCTHIMLVVLLFLFALGCHRQQRHFTRDEALSVLEAHRHPVEALAGITGTGVTVDAAGSYHIRLTFASQKYINRLREQSQLPTSLDGVSVQVGIENSPQVDEIIQDDILLRITTDKTVYEPGENVIITAYVENQSSGSIGFTYGTAGKIAITLHSHEDPYDLRRYVILLNDGGKTQFVTMIAYGDSLDAAESITRETFWDQKFLDGASEVDAWFGRYVVAASFLLNNLSPGIETQVTVWAGS